MEGLQHVDNERGNKLESANISYLYYKSLYYTILYIYIYICMCVLRLDIHGLATL